MAHWGTRQQPSGPGAADGHPGLCTLHVLPPPSWCGQPRTPPPPAARTPPRQPLPAAAPTTTGHPGATSRHHPCPLSPSPPHHHSCLHCRAHQLHHDQIRPAAGLTTIQAITTGRGPCSRAPSQAPPRQQHPNTLCRAGTLSWPPPPQGVSSPAGCAHRCTGSDRLAATSPARGGGLCGCTDGLPGQQPSPPGQQFVGSVPGDAPLRGAAPPLAVPGGC